MPVSGIAVAYCTAGGLILYSGIKGATISNTISTALKGNLTLSNTEPISAESTGNPDAVAIAPVKVTGSVNGAMVATDALKYAGHSYVYGGVPGISGISGWDCSSYVNWVFGHDFMISLPGDVTNYDGTTHGPVASDYLSWPGAVTIRRNDIQAGDLCNWSTHIGIAINNSQMISALNPSLGTAVTGIEQGGPQDETLTCRRINAVNGPRWLSVAKLPTEQNGEIIMATAIAVNVSTQGKQIWSGRKTADINSLLLMNTDLNNTVQVGNDLTAMVVPIAPNGSLSVDPSQNWYIVGNVTGSAPLIVVPNGQSNFLGLTQALGQLAIPSVRSPNYAAGLAGWTINKDGSAEFNNLTIRGTFNGTDFIINSNGAFFYSGTPALGNLIASITNANGTDGFTNLVYSGICQYGANGTPAATLITRLVDGQVLVGSAAAMIGWPGGTVTPGALLGPAVGGGYAEVNSGITGPGDTMMRLLLQSVQEAGNGTPQATLEGILNFINAARPTSSGTYLWSDSGVAGALITSGFLNAVQPGTVSTPETWHTISSFLNGWAATANTPRYRFTVDNKVELDGVIDASAATAATFANMPSGYRPVSPTKLWAAGANGGVPAGQSPFIQVNNTGSIAALGITVGTAGAHVTISGRYPLD